jgi:RNA polymerase sigma factor (sigma-70 family)
MSAIEFSSKVCPNDVQRREIGQSQVKTGIGVPAEVKNAGRTRTAHVFLILRVTPVVSDCVYRWEATMTLTPTTRASLLFRLRNSHDHEAWLEFVSIYEPVAYRLLRRHELQDADAREIMQEIFIAVSRSIDRWDSTRERGSFRGWLRRAARNLFINWLKQRQRRVAATGGSDLQAMLDMLPADCGSESVEFDHELRRAIFQRAAERVRDDVQPVTWQAFWETGVVGTSAADAAKKLGMRVGAIRVAKCRVLARLQAAVNEIEKST